MFGRNRNAKPDPATNTEVGRFNTSPRLLGEAALHQDVTVEDLAAPATHEILPVLTDDEMAAISAFRDATRDELASKTASGVRAGVMLTATTVDKRIISIVDQDGVDGARGHYTVRTGPISSLIAGEDLPAEDIGYDDERVMGWRGDQGTSIEIASGETIYVPKPFAMGRDQTPMLIGADDSETPLFILGSDNRPITSSTQ